MAKIRISYNKEDDVLYIDLAKSKNVFAEGNTKLVKKTDASGKVVGYVIFNFSKREKLNLPLNSR